MGMLTAGLHRLRRQGLNPVLVKELRSRFRGGGAFWTVSAYLAVLTLMVWQWHRWWSRSAGLVVAGGQDPANFGRQLFQAVTWLELSGILVIAPALTFNAISGERERQTLDLLLATPQSPRAILRGKLMAAMAYVLLLVVSALPVLSMVFFFGGVSWQQVLRSQLAVMVGGLTLASLGLLASVVARQTVRAAVLATMGAGLLTLVPVLVSAFRALVDFSGRPLLEGSLWSALFAMSPLMMMTAIGRADVFLPSLLAQLWLAGVLQGIAGWRLSGKPQGAGRLRLPLLWLALALAWLAWIARFHPNGIL